MEKFEKYVLPALTGALNLYYVLLTGMMLILFVTFNGEFFHSLPKIGVALMIYHPITVAILLIGAVAGLTFRLKIKAGQQVSPWNFTGVWQILACFMLSLLLLAAAEFILPRPVVQQADSNEVLKAVMELQETSDMALVIGATQHSIPDIRIAAMNRLIPGRYNRIHLTEEQEGEVAHIFMKALKDPHVQVRDLALSYTDDIVQGPIGNKYYTSMDVLHIRRIYQKAIIAGEPLNRESALLNIGNLIQADDPKGPVFYREQLMRAYSDMKLKPQMRSKLLEHHLLFAANYRSDSFTDLVDWAIELLESPDLDSRIWREAIKFIAKFDVPVAQNKLAELLAAEKDEAKRLFIQDCIHFKGVLPVSIDSSEIQMEMKLKGERLKERMKASGKEVPDEPMPQQ